MCRVRRNAYPLPVDSIQFDGTSINLGVSKTNDQGSKQRLYPFPVQLTTEEDLLDALLLASGSTDAMVYLHRTTKRLFNGRSCGNPWHHYVSDFITGLRCGIEELSLIPKGQMLRISMTTPCGSQIELQDSTHYIYRVCMENGETWAVDITGAQYGHHEVLYRWDDYRRERCERITEQRHFGYLRQAPETFLQKRTLVEAIDSQISARAELFGVQLNNVLKGSHAKFRAARQEFLQQFDTDVLASLEGISKSRHPLSNKPGVVAKPSQNKLVDDNAANTIKETWDLAISPEKEAESGSRLYIIKAIAGKGKGLVAITKIARGTRILSEIPIFMVPRDNPNIKRSRTPRRQRSKKP